MFVHQDDQATCQAYPSTRDQNVHSGHNVPSAQNVQSSYQVANQANYEMYPSTQILNSPTTYPSGGYETPAGKDDKDFSDAYPDASAAFLGPKLWDQRKTAFVDIDKILESSPTNDCLIKDVYQSLLTSFPEEYHDESIQQLQGESQEHQVPTQEHQVSPQQDQVPPQQHQVPPQQHQLSNQQQWPSQQNQVPPQQHHVPPQQQWPSQKNLVPPQQHQVPSRDYQSMHFKDNQGGKDDKDFSDVCPDASAAFLGPNLWDEYKTAFIDIDSFLGASPDDDRIIENLDQSIHASIQEQGSDESQTLPQLVQPHQLQAPQVQPTQHQVSPQPQQTPPQPHQVPPQPRQVSPQPCQVPPQHQIQPQIQIPSEESHNMHYQDMGEGEQPSPQSSMDSGTMQSGYSDVEDKRSRMYSVDCKFSPTDLALATPPGHKHYDPASTVFPDDELKPQPIIKKSRKNFVPDNMKDDRYWARRYKNNIAAKRSREARRLKENQIVLRASYLEKENNNLREDVNRLKAENDLLKEKIRKYEV